MKCYRYTYPIEKTEFLPLQENALFLDIETTGFQRNSTFLTIIGLAWQERNTIVIEQWMNEIEMNKIEMNEIETTESSESATLWNMLEQGSLIHNTRTSHKAHDAFPVKDKLAFKKTFEKPTSRHPAPPLSIKERGLLEEKELLIHLEQLLSEKKTLPVLIHYNGTTFDLPYLKSKYEQHQLSSSLPDCTSIDLYRCAKKYRHFLATDGLKQKNLEEAFGLFREDTLSGQELIETYLEGIRNQDERLLNLYLLHNKEDMEGMVFLQNLLRLDQLFEGDFNIDSWEEQPDLSSLFVRIPCGFSLKRSISRDVDGIHLHMKGDTLFLKIPIQSLEAKYFYSDYKNYYYLPMEDRAIHKSVASFVEKEFREKAKKENCYSRKTDTFYPLPLSSSRKERKECLENCCNLNLFYQNYGGDTAYLLCSCPELKDEAGRRAYIKSLLRLFLKG